jgi:predicted Zn-dependent peptidase
MTSTIHVQGPDLTLLRGGLPLLVHRRPGPAILAARLAIPGGSGRDPVGQRGAHQLLAGLMTRGCGDLDADALADRVEGRGASLRAEAHEDALVLALKCAADDAADLLPLLPAMARRPTLLPDQLELERQLNLQTLQRQREDPYQLAHDQLRQALYDDGPYGHDPLGVDDELAGLGPSQLEPLIAALGEDGAVLVLSGDPPDRVVEVLEEALAAAPWITHLPRTAPAQAAPAPLRRLATLEQDTEQLVLMLGAATIPLGDPDALPLRFLQAHLGIGMSSRLFLSLREERGLAYDVGVHMPARRGAAPFVMHLSSSVDRAGEATRCLLDEWQRTLEVPISGAERQLALAKLRGQDAMARQTCRQIAERQALVLSHGLPEDHVERMLARAAVLTPDEVLGAARRHLRGPSLSLVGPAEALAAATAAWQEHPLSRAELPR